MTSETINTFIPSADDIATPRGGWISYRFANGEIVTGRDKDGTLTKVDKIVGRLRRIGIYSGKTKEDDKAYMQLEADVETTEGLVGVKSGLLDTEGRLRPTVSALCWAEGLLEVGKDELFLITASRGEKETRYGNYVTYVNLFHVDIDPESMKAKAPRAVKRRPFDKNKKQTMEERWEELRPEIESHPAFAERPENRHDDDEADENQGVSHYSELVKEAAAKGWPTPEQAPNEWLALLAAALEHDKRGKISDYSESEWETMREAIKHAPNTVPGVLQPAAERMKEKSGPATKVNANAFGSDPFAGQ